MTPRFDYGEFRTIAEVATSSARYETFGFVFENPGTYVFSTSCDSTSLIVLAVMGEDVRYFTAHYCMDGYKPSPWKCFTQSSPGRPDPSSISDASVL